MDLNHYFVEQCLACVYRVYLIFVGTSKTGAFSDIVNSDIQLHFGACVGDFAVQTIEFKALHI